MTKSKRISKARIKWTVEQLVILRARYPDEPTKVIAGAVDHTVEQTYKKAISIGLRKSANYLASPAAGRLQRGGNVGAAGRFQKGHASWNKGTNFAAGGRSPETRFKPGQSPKNTMAVGAYRFDKNGVLQRKIGNSPGSNSKRWRGVHELVWVDANGPLPPKHIVVFKPGMRTNVLEEITLDRVECISLAENMRRNTVHNMPKELVDMVRLRAVLTRHIHRKEKNVTTENN